MKNYHYVVKSCIPYHKEYRTYSLHEAKSIARKLFGFPQINEEEDECNEEKFSEEYYAGEIYDGTVEKIHTEIPFHYKENKNKKLIIS